MKRVLLAGCLLAVAACQQPTAATPQVSDMELQKEQAEEQRIVNEYAKQGGAPRPWRNRKGMSREFEQAAARVDEAGAALCKDIGLPQRDMRCYYYFDKSRSREINAHTDGETIVINLGMQRFVKDEDELAMVMAHELAHSLMGHVSAQQNNALAGGLIGALLEGVAASQGYGGGGDMARSGYETGALAFSPSFEEEADYIGLYIAARAGYDIAKAPDIWRRMSVENPDGIYNATTHPSNAARYVALQKTIGEIERKRSQHVALVPEFKQMAAK